MSNNDINDVQIHDSAPMTGAHTHTLPDGTVVTHSHDHGFEYEEHKEHGNPHHGHTHSHTQQRAVINRLARAVGHLDAVKRMVEDERDCTDVLIQLSAVQAALSNTAKIILKDHIQHCMIDAVNEGDAQALEDLNEAIEKFMR